jgi:hypothetical protein
MGFTLKRHRLTPDVAVTETLRMSLLSRRCTLRCILKYVSIASTESLYHGKNTS